MYNVGVFPGKFCPPHRGHITEILKASCLCKTLYVVVSHHDELDKELFAESKMKPITYRQKVKWLSIELSEFDHIKIVGLNEGNIPIYPYGWEPWSRLLKEVVGEKIDVIFGGEPEYAENGYTKYFPETVYHQYERKDSLYPISATEIRANPYMHWNYILGAAREHFTKRVLISGTESAGKTTMTKMLAKIFYTSWSREEGRYYSQKYFGGCEAVFEPDDFFKICWEQRDLDDHALKTANRIVFHDTDAVVTQFYCDMYLGKTNPKIETFIDPDRYDVILLLTPEVKWVDDGLRWNNENDVRWHLHHKLKQMYIDRGFGDKIIEIGGASYISRIGEAIQIARSLLGDTDCNLALQV